MLRSSTDHAFIAGMRHVSSDVRRLDEDSPFFDQALSARRHIWDQTRLYYEAHITVEPSVVSVEDFRRMFGTGLWRFSMDEVDGIRGMWFISSRSQSRQDMVEMVVLMVSELRAAGLTVLRAKIEETILDSKYGDEI